MTLIVVLAGIGLATYRPACTARRKRCLRKISSACGTRSISTTPTKASTRPISTALVTEGYLRQIPKDPFTESADTWQTVMSEPDPAIPVPCQVCYDVKSGAEGVSLDGTPYADLQ